MIPKPSATPSWPFPPTAIKRSYAIFPIIVSMSDAENARNVSVRMFPNAPMLSESAVAEMSSNASVIVTISYRP